MAHSAKQSITAVVLTNGQREEVCLCLDSLSRLDPPFSEIILVVNNSYSRLIESIPCEIPHDVKVCVLGGNFGAPARTIGAQQASSEYLCFLDDDMTFAGADGVALILAHFADHPKSDAICLKITEEGSENFQSLTWGHPRDVRTWQDRSFRTDCITEGAFVVRRDIFLRSGGYWSGIFIGEEGVDLFFRLLKLGVSVIYTPRIRVIHHHAQGGRQYTRGFYNYPRSDVLIAWRHLGSWDGALLVFRTLALLHLQAIRERRLRVLLDIYAGWLDGLATVLGREVRRNPISEAQREEWRKIQRHKPSLLKRAVKHLTQKTI